MYTPTETPVFYMNILRVANKFICLLVHEYASSVLTAGFVFGDKDKVCRRRPKEHFTVRADGKWYTLGAHGTHYVK